MDANRQANECMVQADGALFDQDKARKAHDKLRTGVLSILAGWETNDAKQMLQGLVDRSEKMQAQQAVIPVPAAPTTQERGDARLLDCIRTSIKKKDDPLCILYDVLTWIENHSR